jgi:O-antigen/teichoic acid export membrane protein
MALISFAQLSQIPKSYSSLAKNTLLLFCLRGIQKLLGLIVIYVLVRALDQESFGEYNLVLTCVSLCSLFALPGLKNAVMQSIARKHPGTYRAAVPLGFFSSFIGSAILLVAGLWYWVHDNQELGIAFVICALIFPFAEGITQWRGFKTGQEDFKGIVRLEAFAIAARNLLIILAILLVPGSIILPLAIFFGVAAAQNIIQTYITSRSVSSQSLAEEGSLSYGFKLSLYKGFDTVATQLDRFLIFFLLSPVSLALFVAALKVPELIKGLIIDIAVVLGPRFAKHKSYKAHIDKALKIFSLVVGATIVTIAFTILPRLFILIFGESYSEAIPYAQALMCSYAISNNAQFKVRFIKSQLDSKSVREISIVMALSRIILSVCLIPTLGLLGAVISIFSVRVINTLTINFIMKKRYPVEVEAL